MPNLTRRSFIQWSLAGPAVAGLSSRDLVAYWPFDEANAAIARDASGQGHHLQLDGARRGRGAVGTGLEFRGAASNVRTALTNALQPADHVTVEAWARLDKFPPKSEGIGLVSAGNSYLLRFSGMVPSFHIFTDHWGPVQADGSVRLNQWYHLVGTYDGRQMRIYVNGRLAGARRREGPINQTKQTLFLGRQVNPLHGCLDEVRIYRRALAPDEIATAFKSAHAKLNTGVHVGALVEPFEDLFGPTCGRPAPLATLEHLERADLTFAVITDTHIGQPGEEGRFCHNWRVEETIRQINAIRPDFVLHCGDIITTFPFSPAFENQCRHAVKMLRKFNVPVHLVPGNHDIGNQRNMRVWTEKFLQRIDNRPLEAMLFKPVFRDLYRKHFGDDYYSFRAGDCCFLIFNNQICNSGYPLEQEQLAWLERELQKARPAKATFLFMHNPLFWNRPGEPGPKNYEPVLEPARTKLLELIRKHAVTAVYTGHTHRAFQNEYHGTHMRTVNSTTFNRNYAGIDLHIPGEAQIYDSHKLGFLIVRMRGRQIHESWVPLCWRLGQPPARLARIAGPRIVARPSTESSDGALNVTATPPTPYRQGTDSRELVDDHAWRLAEDVGAKWLQIVPPPDNEDRWSDLHRGLTLGRPRGVKLAVPLPADPAERQAAFSKLKPHAVDAVVVPNGRPADPKAPLASWQLKGTPADWAEACAAAGKLTAGSTRVVLARLPLAGDQSIDGIRHAASALEKKAHALAVWLTTQTKPEALADRIAAAAQIARTHGLQLWLDVAAWQRVDEPRRSAYMLRLLALCQAQNVRLFWWIGSGDAAGLLDSHGDPTPAYFAAQAWHAFVDGPAQPVNPRVGESVQLEWQDHRGRQYILWWRASDNPAVGDAPSILRLPKNPVIIDPMHGRLVKRDAQTQLPICNWPLVARGQLPDES